MKKHLLGLLKQHLLIIVFLSFYFIITAYKFISHPTPFYDWDESIYAQVGREMVRQKSLVPLWQGQYWLDKPPLAPLTYGIIESVVPAPPEISTRIFTLLLSILNLFLFYIFYYRLTKNKIVPLLTVIISSFTPVFLQRAQVLNVDVFLMLGWIGYLVFYSNFRLSLIFLAIGVLSKSLLGFYPVIGMFVVLLLQFCLKQIDFKSFKRQLKSMSLQVGILSLWYVIMLIAFKYAFIKNQFLEAMLKRVTASIESHFGQRTYYITMLFEQIKYLVYPALFSIILIAIKLTGNLFKKNNNLQSTINDSLLLIFFVPWFLFLNLTKTKIAWYIYPVIIQFSFLGVYLLLYFKKYRLITTLIAIVTLVVVFNQAFRKNNFFTTYYSSYDQYYHMAVYARDNCHEYIEMLVDPNTRQTYDVLNKMNLTISTTKWWGNHPSVVYYSDKKVNFIYDIYTFNKTFQNSSKNQCFALSPQDLSLTNIPSSKVTKKYQDILIIK